MANFKIVNRLDLRCKYDSIPKKGKGISFKSLSDSDIIRGRKNAVDDIDAYRSRHTQEETQAYSHGKMFGQWKHIKEGKIRSYVGSSLGAEEEYSHYSYYGRHRFKEGK